MKDRYWFRRTLLLSLFVFGSLIFFILFSCTSSEDSSFEKILIIASKKVDCTGVSSQKCFLVKEEATQNWEYFYDKIKGFSYEEGFEYELIVSEKTMKPVADGSSIETTLIRIISKVLKESENLPTACSKIEKPLENLVWLKEIKIAFEQSTSAIKKQIIQYTYKENTVFLIDDCASNCNDALQVVYNCFGEKICEFGGIAGLNTCLDFKKEATNKKMLWEN